MDRILDKVHFVSLTLSYSFIVGAVIALAAGLFLMIFKQPFQAVLYVGFIAGVLGVLLGGIFILLEKIIEWRDSHPK